MTVPPRGALATTRPWRVDSLGVGYTAHRGRIEAHYPGKNPDGSNRGAHGAAFDLGPIPESYWTDPPNEITRERAALWKVLLEGE